MRVLMLGWEFPPFISGGLGTACYGLTKAMSRMGTEVLFVLPKAVDAQYSSHVQIISPTRSPAPGSKLASPAAMQTGGTGVTRLSGSGSAPNVSTSTAAEPAPFDHPDFERVSFKTIPTWLGYPYQTPKEFAQFMAQRRRAAEQHAKDADLHGTRGAAIQSAPAPGSFTTPHSHDHDWDTPATTSGGGGGKASDATDYCGDIITEVQRYTDLCVRLTRGEHFDVIHAHDWMTYPAGMAIAGMTGKPLVVHVHSTEFDRSGESVHSQIYDIERRGMHAATRVICVSHLTKKICEHRYAVPSEKMHVCYNGIETSDAMPVSATIGRGEKIVLFLGRITMQKGPEYFVAAAKKVLQVMDKVKFVMAGSGDMAAKVIELAAQMGIGHKILFTGFLRGKDVERIFRMADVYVMPSVSEPFGIAPLEAIRHDVPVIISKSSGVSEVIHHALKVDFWDVDEMANKIIAVIKHPPLSQTLREHADFEIRKLTWDGAADKCVRVYHEAIDAMNEPSHAPGVTRLTSGGGFGKRPPVAPVPLR
ncbi:MAG: glycosyltransferase [Phycisphaerales bacterium]